MRLLIPFAGPRPAPWAEWQGPGLSGLPRLPNLPNLQTLLARWAVTAREDGDELSLSPPHERALAQALGWRAADGCLPWAARAAAADGIDVGSDDGSTATWGLLTPAHWHLGTDQVSLIDPAGLMLDAATSRALFDAVQDLFASAGWRLVWGAPLRWYAAHDSLHNLPCAALDRVIGRNVDRWLGDAPALRTVRRMQAEVQMLLYTHPLNDERAARGLLPVNSFWLSGCGRAQLVTATAPDVDDRLRGPALAGDWAAWLKAWETLDEGPIQRLLAAASGTNGKAAAAKTADTADSPVSLTLCGDRSAVTYTPVAQSLLAGMLQRFKPAPPVHSALEAL